MTKPNDKSDLLNNSKQHKTKKKSTQYNKDKKGNLTKKDIIKKVEKKELPLKTKEIFLEETKKIEERIIKTVLPQEDFSISGTYIESKTILNEYITLDWKHSEHILQLILNIKSYAQDIRRKRPLNILMQANPGSGKSHFVKCISYAMSNSGVKEVTYNMASMEKMDDLINPIESVRNLKVNDKLPLLFLDEFDSNDKFYSLLLPLLWDGELQLGHRYIRVGKIVIILAGSSPKIIEAMKESRKMKTIVNTDETKLVDLLSRINGGEFTIPDLDEIEPDRNRKVDKVLITVAILVKRFGRSLSYVPWALLSFIANCRFRYGVRSIIYLIDLIPRFNSTRSELTLDDLELPLSNKVLLEESSLSHHIIADDGPASVVDLWNELTKSKAKVEIITAFRYPSL